jgi:hypothetical protein
MRRALQQRSKLQSRRALQVLFIVVEATSVVTLPCMLMLCVLASQQRASSPDVSVL